MVRTVSFRYIVVRDGADFSEIYPAQNGTQSIKMSGSGAIKTRLTGSFVDPGDSVTWLSDEIRPEMIIDGVPYPLGIYMPASVREMETTTERSLSIEAYDRCWRVRDLKTEDLLHFDAGTPYIAAVQQLLTACGIALVSVTPNDAVFAEAREDWNIGTDYLSIVNQLLSEINYNPLWFDASGLAILEPASIPTAANIEHTLDDTDIRSLILPSLSHETDIYQAPNVFVCVCSNADKSDVMRAKSENTNPQSPLSIARRGRRIVKVTQVNNIASQEELQAYADRMRNESMITGETIILKTGLFPGFGVNDVTAVRYGELFAVCLETAWDMNLQVGGTMTHTLEKVVINLG